MNGRKWYSAGAGAVVFVLIVALVAVAGAVCGSASASDGPTKLGEPDNGKAYTVKVGDTIEVALPGNATTGFAWAAALSEEDAALLEQVGEPAYVSDSTDESLVGVGGVYTFTFKAIAEGQANLKLVYARSWEDVDPEAKFEVEVTVE